MSEKIVQLNEEVRPCEGVPVQTGGVCRSEDRRHLIELALLTRR
jgi:hypothetical protein